MQFALLIYESMEGYAARKNDGNDFPQSMGASLRSPYIKVSNISTSEQ